MTETAVDSCAITWWRGYVRGRFQALTQSDPPLLIAESDPVRERGSTPPKTDEAVAALEGLTRRLVDEGWSPVPNDAADWYELHFSRPAVPPAPVEEPEERGDDRRSHDTADVELVARLHAELRAVRETAERERRARLEAEQQARRAERVVAPLPVRAAAPPARRTPRTSGRVLALWVAVVAVVALGVAAASRSPYATAVATLTATAVALGVDSWRVAHRR
jgi:hypothetical protein